LGRPLRGLTLTTGALALWAAPVRAQCPCPEENQGWAGNVSVGIALTSGNADTKTYNLSGKASSDQKKRNVLKLDGLYLRTSTEDEVTVSRTAAGVRDEYRLGERSYTFGDLRYLRDRFKEIDYLVSTLVGAGYRLLDGERAKLSVDAAVGGAFERLEDQAATTSGAYQLGQALDWKVTKTTTLAESAKGLWKMEDASDAIYRFEISLSTSISEHLEMKLAFADDYKNKPAAVGVEKNDTTFLAAVAYRF
jgi:putative salt-induced outer membrane protein YdiY